MAPIWRVRVVGPRIQLLHVRRELPTLWSAKTELCRGEYFLEVLLLYRELVQADDVAHTCEEAKRLLLTPFYFTSTLDCEFDSGWMVAGVVSIDDVKLLANTRIQQPIPSQPGHWYVEESLSLNRLNSVLQYKRHHACDSIRLHARVCLVGDSQMRLLYINIAKLRGFNCSHTDKEVCDDPSNTFFYSRMTFPTDTLTLPENCSLIIINVGQWSASLWNGYPDNVHPEPVASYASKLRTMLLQLVEKIDEKRCWFLSTQPAPFGWLQLSCPPRDWRTNPVILEYNMVAKRIIGEIRDKQRARIEFVDLQHIIAPVQDLSSDWNHYDSKIRNGRCSLR